MIQTYLCDVQLRFEDQFKSLEYEIRHRDTLINHLQHRIQELEDGHISPDGINAILAATGNGSTGSSDIPFVVSAI